MSYLDKDSEEKFVRFVERMPTVSYIYLSDAST